MEKNKKTPQKAALAAKPSNVLSVSTKKEQTAKKEKKSVSSHTLSHEMIAVRAYFISERRRELGWDGNEETDWSDAEKQLRAEFADSQKKKK